MLPSPGPVRQPGQRLEFPLRQELPQSGQSARARHARKRRLENRHSLEAPARQQDADRSLISNIHDDGIPADQAASDAISLVDQILATGGSGVSALLAAHDRRAVRGGE